MREVNKCNWESGEAAIASLREQVADYEAALTNACKELGVPIDGYPAPVCNAYEIMSEVLEKWKNES